MVPLTYGFTKPYLKRLAFLPLENIDFGKKKKKKTQAFKTENLQNAVENYAFKKIKRVFM
jgi:hypothetical protein